MFQYLHISHLTITVCTRKDRKDSPTVKAQDYEAGNRCCAAESAALLPCHIQSVTKPQHPCFLVCKLWLWFTPSTRPIHLLWSQDVLQSRTNNELKEIAQETSMFLEVNTFFTSSLMTTWSYWKDTEWSKKHSGSCRSWNAFTWIEI